MTKICLSPGKIKKLRREASGSTHAFRQLCRETITRKWLRIKGIPAWMNPRSPPDEYSAKSSRYGLMLSDGSRFMVCRVKDAVISFDAVAAARCFAVLAVSLEDDCSSGEPVGYTPLCDMGPAIHRFDFTGTGCGTPASFLTRIKPDGSYLAALLKFSIRTRTMMIHTR